MLALLLSITMAAAASSPPTTAPTPAPCAAPQYHQFDFWIGDWTVKENGKFAGTNEIDSIQRGCAIQEHWTDADGHIGTSFSIYYAPAAQWHQTWIDSGGSLLRMDGGMVNGSMVMQGTRVGKKYKQVIDKTTWTPLPDGRVHQFWQYSIDGGKTWQTAFDGYYTRVR